MTKSILGIAIAAMMAVTSVQARDLEGRYAGSPLKPWFEGLRNKVGKQCCANVDGIALSDVDWDSKDNHYRVRIGGEWIDVPEDAVITEPNRAERTIVWPFYLDGKPIIRCFLPGSMT
jgi:hypothetical protein